MASWQPRRSILSRVSRSAASHPVNDALALHASDLARPWLWWRLLTYGFAHDSYPAIGHILFNMLGLFFLGPPIEQRYGKREFLRLYLALIVFSGLVWASVALLRGVPPQVGVVGASGAVVGVVLLFALNYPRQTVYLYMLFPVPAWVIGVVIVLADLYGALNPARGMHIAVEAHLAGAALAILYWRLGWNFTRLTDKLALGKLFERRPRLKVHRPDDSLGDQDAAPATRSIASWKNPPRGRSQPDAKRTPHPPGREPLSREASQLVLGRVTRRMAFDREAARRRAGGGDGGPLAAKRVLFRSAPAVTPVGRVY